MHFQVGPSAEEACQEFCFSAKVHKISGLEICQERLLCKLALTAWNTPSRTVFQESAKAVVRLTEEFSLDLLRHFMPSAKANVRTRISYDFGIPEELNQNQENPWCGGDMQKQHFSRGGLT